MIKTGRDGEHIAGWGGAQATSHRLNREPQAAAKSLALGNLTPGALWEM